MRTAPKIDQAQGEVCAMCRLFATQDPKSYQCVTRAVRLNGYTTSIRLESEFWDIIDTIAAREGLSTGRFLGKLYDEVLDHRGEVRNFTSMLRVTCVLYLRQGEVRPAETQPEKTGLARTAARELVEIASVVA
jgi:predicted DNA-binding ribbon-helix-helix protein